MWCTLVHVRAKVGPTNCLAVRYSMCGYLTKKHMTQATSTSLC